MPDLTEASLLAALREMKGKLSVTPTALSFRLVYSDMALKETTERLFPASRHRSRRVLKKLIKRHGGEFRKQAVMWRIGDTIYAHPSFRSQLEAQFKETKPDVQMHARHENPLLWPPRMQVTRYLGDRS